MGTSQSSAGPGSGVPMVTFGLASTERRLENGVWVDAHTNYYNVSVFRALAEHAYASLERGQRVIVVGKLKVRPWQSGDRSGTSVDLEAASLGHDLMFGTTTFAKGQRGARRAETAAAADEWAPDPAQGSGSIRAGLDAGTHAESRVDATVDAAVEAPVLASTADWGAPEPEPVPF